jgi:hypothetical protein
MTQFWYKDNQSIESYQSGYSFGMLFYSSFPNLDRSALYQKMVALRVSKRFIRSVYNQGFELGYLSKQRHNNQETSLTEVMKEQEKHTMGTIRQHQQNIQESSPMLPFTKATELAKKGIPFCIQKVRQIPGMDGHRQWALDIIVSDDFLFETKANEDGACTLTLSLDNGQRDALMNEIRTDVPIHNVCLQRVQTKSGYPYFKLDDVEGDIPCPCTSNGSATTEHHDIVEDEEEDEETKEIQRLLAAQAKRKQAKSSTYGKTEKLSTVRDEVEELLKGKHPF